MLVAIGAWLSAGVELCRGGRRVDTRRSAAVVGVAAVAALVASWSALKGGSILDEFRGSKAQVTQSPNRLADISSNNRWTWWQEAWQLSRTRRAGGKGAGTFEIARRPIRVGSIVTTEPHNLPLQFLAETGIVGFLLLLGLIGAGAAAASAPCGRPSRSSGRAAGALAIALGAFALHALVDIDWDFVAVAAPRSSCSGVLVGLGARRSARPPRAVPRRGDRGRGGRALLA